MIDTLFSKIGLTVAVIVIVGALVALFSLQKEGFRLDEIEATADSVQMRVDELSSLNAETTVPVYHGGEQADGAVVLPRDIFGDPYRMDLFPTAVLIDQRGMLGRATFQHTVHLFHPGDATDFTQTDLSFLDGVFGKLSVTVDQDLVLDRRYYGSAGYQTFLYLETCEGNQSVADSLAESIDSHAMSGKNSWSIECPDCDVQVVPNFVCALGKTYSCVAMIHVNQTYDPEDLWASDQAVTMEEFAQKGSENNEVIAVKKGDSFTLERYYVTVKVKTYKVGSSTPTEITIRVLQSFAYGG